MKRLHCLCLMILSMFFSRPLIAWIPEIIQNPNPKHYLPDFSYAGYKNSQQQPEAVGEIISVTDFGAIPNDLADDTAAFREALAKAHKIQGPVQVVIPSGRYDLSGILIIKRSNIYLRGLGKVILKMHMPLSKVSIDKELKPVKNACYSRFSWHGGLIWVANPYEEKQLQLKALAGSRGDNWIQLDRKITLGPGEILKVKWVNNKGSNSSLLHHFYGVKKRLRGANLAKEESAYFFQHLTIKQIIGNTVYFDEPLAHDVKKDWKIELIESPMLEEVGVENLHIQFPQHRPSLHHFEKGYNALFFSGVKNGWIRNVTSINVDNGINISSSTKVTVEKVVIKGSRAHHPIVINSSSHVLVKDFQVHNKAIHSLSFGTRTTRSVFTNGVVVDASLDLHRGFNGQNLFEQITAIYLTEKPKRSLFNSSGSWKAGPHSGAHTTFWNILVKDKKRRYTPRIEKLVGPKYIFKANLIGVNFLHREAKLKYGEGSYIEGTNQLGISIPSLFNYQLCSRLLVSSSGC